MSSATVESAAGLDGLAGLAAEGDNLETHVPPSGVFPKTMLFNGIAASGKTAHVSGDRRSLLYSLTLD